MSLLTGHPRSARVSMSSEGVLLELPKEALSELFTSAPELLAKVSASMLSRTEQSDAVRRRSDPLAQQDHASRVEALVLQMRRFFGLLRH
jgi:CRP-like cAMP-binding protein